MGQANISSSISSLSKSELLDRAREYLFSTGVNDCASKLCKANMKYGLAQFHLIQEKYGFEPKALFISSPDEIISRNLIRWDSGLGYGGRLSWGDGTQKLIFLNTKPNQCGILAGGMEEPPSPYELIKKIDELKNIEIYHDNIPLKWDYGISNHFINCFKVFPLSDLDLPPYMFIIHGSAPELRDDTNGIGFYFDKSQTLRDMAIKEHTVFGTQYILVDESAKEYLAYTDKALNFSMVKRELIAKKLFGEDCKIICNQPHQFLKDYNNMYLGSNCTDISSNKIKNNIFPITLRADISAYLFKGKKNLSELTIKNLGFLERAKDLEVLDTLLNANILPHGGGYKFPDIKDVHQILEYKYQKYFSCSMMVDTNRYKIIRDPSQMEYEYRGKEVVLKTLQLNLGENMARLSPIFSLKL